MPVYLDFLQVAGKKLQLALCGSNLPTLLECQTTQHLLVVTKDLSYCRELTLTL